MIITTRFDVGAPLEVAWRYLLDVPKIAHCVPGAQLSEVIDERTYAGNIQVKLGPIVVSYKGRIHLEEVDEQAHVVRLKAEGVETRGRGGATATVKGELHSDGGRTVVTMESDVAVSGLVAQFGRSAIMQDVAQRLAQQFANCLEEQLKAEGAIGAPPPAATGGTSSQAPSSQATASGPSVQASSRPVGAFGLLWEVLAARLGRLFKGGRRAN